MVVAMVVVTNSVIGGFNSELISIGIRRLNLLLPITQTRYNSQKKQIHLGHISPWETMSLEKNPPILEIPNFFFQDKWLLLWLL